MTDSKMLKEKIKNAGLKLYYVAGVLGLSRQGFRNKLEGRTDFILPEVQKLCELLRLDAAEREAIFFAEKVDK